MKHFLLNLFLLLFTTVAFAQIEKGRWIVGGDGSFSSDRSNVYYAQKLKNTTVFLSPGAGYFLINNLATGLRLNYTYYKTSHTATTGEKIYDINRELHFAPYARYYFLPKEQKVNFLVDASYYFGKYNFKSNNRSSIEPRNGYSLGAGPTLFLAPNSAVELTLNYTHRNLQYYNRSSLNANIGFQVYLGKSKNKQSS